MSHTGPLSYAFLPNGAANVKCCHGHIVDHLRPGIFDIESAGNAPAFTCTLGGDDV